MPNAVVKLPDWTKWIACAWDTFCSDCDSDLCTSKREVTTDSILRFVVYFLPQQVNLRQLEIQHIASLHDLLLAVVAVGVRAAAVARVDVAAGRHVEGAGEVVARTLAVELAGAEVDVGGAVAVHPRLGLDAVGAGVAGVEGDIFEDGEHSGTSMRKTAMTRGSEPSVKTRAHSTQSGTELNANVRLRLESLKPRVT